MPGIYARHPKMSTTCGRVPLPANLDGGPGGVSESEENPPEQQINDPHA
jgi:hypothetical protein